MLSSDNVGVHDTGGGVQGVHSRVDTQLSDGTWQHSGGIQVSKGGGGRRVSQVISWHINSLKKSLNILQISLSSIQLGSYPPWTIYLHRCDWTLLGGGDSLLHGTHVSGQSGLVPHSRGDTTQQGRHLRINDTVIKSANIFSNCNSIFKSTANSFHGPQNQPVWIWRCCRWRAAHPDPPDHGSTLLQSVQSEPLWHGHRGARSSVRTPGRPSASKSKG